MTNLEYIKSLPAEEIAFELIDWCNPSWITTDGKIFEFSQDAIRYEIEWLKMERKNDEV